MRKLLAVALACLLTACGGGGDRAGVQEISGPAPAIHAPMLGRDGDLTPASYRGRVLVVNFFNPFCGPCREEQPLLARFDRERGDGVVVVGVHYVGGSWPKSARAALRYARGFHVGYPLVEDRSSELAREFGIRGIPSTVVVDASGELRFRVLGPLREGELEDLVDAA